MRARRLLTSAVYNPRNLLVFSAMGDGCELVVQSAAAFALEGEPLSYWQLQVRLARKKFLPCPGQAPKPTIKLLSRMQGSSPRGANRSAAHHTGARPRCAACCSCTQPRTCMREQGVRCCASAHA